MDMIGSERSNAIRAQVQPATFSSSMISLRAATAKRGTRVESTVPEEGFGLLLVILHQCVPTKNFVDGLSVSSELCRCPFEMCCSAVAEAAVAWR